MLYDLQKATSKDKRSFRVPAQSLAYAGLVGLGAIALTGLRLRNFV